MFRTESVELVEVLCSRCGGIHVAKKDDCKSFNNHPDYHEAKVFCGGNQCDGFNGEIWRWLHGPARYTTGVVIEETYKHPYKREFIVSEIGVEL